MPCFCPSASSGRFMVSAVQRSALRFGIFLSIVVVLTFGKTRKAAECPAYAARFFPALGQAARRRLTRPGNDLRFLLGALVVSHLQVADAGAISKHRSSVRSGAFEVTA